MLAGNTVSWLMPPDRKLDVIIVIASLVEGYIG